jgi:hypothetical protein
MGNRLFGGDEFLMIDFFPFHRIPPSSFLNIVDSLSCGA